MNNAYIIKRELEKVGNETYLTDGEWTSMPFWAYVYPLWRKKSSAFESLLTEIGAKNDEYYLFIGPKDHNILSLSDCGNVLYDDNKFAFVRKDSVKVSGEVIYYTGILKKIRESEYVEY